jgi:tetratricopeptide (TPR) repeat protein
LDILRLPALLLLAVAACASGARADVHAECERLAVSTDEKLADPQIATCTKAIVAAQGAGDARRLSVAYNRRGLGYLAKRDWDLALADFNAALKISPRYVGALDNRGDAHREKGQFDLALKDYTEALRIDGSYLSAYLNRGRLHQVMGDKARARADFKAVLARRSDGSSLHEWAQDRAREWLKELDAN